MWSDGRPAQAGGRLRFCAPPFERSPPSSALSAVFLLHAPPFFPLRSVPSCLHYLWALTPPVPGFCRSTSSYLADDWWFDREQGSALRCRIFFWSSLLTSVGSLLFSDWRVADSCFRFRSPGSCRSCSLGAFLFTVRPRDWCFGWGVYGRRRAGSFFPAIALPLRLLYGWSFEIWVALLLHTGPLSL